MRHGVFQASGSCSFLEERFKLGYRLTIVGKVVDGKPYQDLTGDRYQIALEAHSESIRLVRSIGERVFIFQIPADDEANLPTLLNALDSEKQHGNLETYGIESFSLMEVFHSLAESSDDFSAYTPSDGSLFGGDERMPYTGPRRRHKRSQPWCFQVALFLWKRWVIQKREMWPLVHTLSLTIVFVALALTILTVKQSVAGPPLTFTAKESRILGETTVDVAGGAAFLNKYTVRQDMRNLVETFRSGLQVLEPSFDISLREEVADSLQLFSLLESSFGNTTGFSTPTGMLVLEDMIKLNWEFDRPFVELLVELVANHLVTEENVEKLVTPDIDINLFPLPDGLLNSVSTADETAPGFSHATSQQSLSSILSFLVRALSKSFLDSNPEDSGSINIKTSATILHNSTAPHVL